MDKRVIKATEQSVTNLINDFFETEQETSKIKKNGASQLLKGLTKGSGTTLQQSSSMSAYEMTRKQFGDIIQEEDVEHLYDELDY